MQTRLTFQRASSGALRSKFSSSSSCRWPARAAPRSRPRRSHPPGCRPSSMAPPTINVTNTPEERWPGLARRCLARAARHEATIEMQGNAVPAGQTQQVDHAGSTAERTGRRHGGGGDRPEHGQQAADQQRRTGRVRLRAQQHEGRQRGIRRRAKTMEGTGHGKSIEGRPCTHRGPPRCRRRLSMSLAVRFEVPAASGERVCRRKPSEYAMIS